MADVPALQRRTALAGLLPWSLAGADELPLVTLSELRFAEQIGLRVKPPVAAYLAGIPLPLEPNRVASMRELRSLWLGPDEWLVTAPQGLAPELMPRLVRALSSRHAIVLDLSARRAIIEIGGSHARTLLEKGCGLDLHPRAFRPGCCAQTLFARLPVIIDQVSAAPAYRLFVQRSAARWLVEWLIDAAEEFRFTA
ncbi:MAG TPA: sarcosine oxidase subunit gamma family protein [Stellaceae bacterium]|jgi:sarcosine oxidase subunit gamma|nr:sarcosine oxidase subunit gamma family protein [Stellaceae bacterium]